MKRHKSLIPLSQDHHNGLMLAQLIKKGAPEYKGLPTNLIGKVNHVKGIWEKELRLHFENEENVLFPFAKGKDEEIDKLIEEILEEHKLIESLVKKLDTSSDIELTLDQLGNILESHIRKEERELFQKIQHCFGEELNKLDGKIIAAKNNCSI